MYAHAFNARAADRKQGFRYEVTLTTRGDLSKPDEQRGTVKAADMHAVRKIAAAYSAKPHNF